MGWWQQGREQGSGQAGSNFHSQCHVDCFAAKTAVVLMAVVSVCFLSNFDNWC